MGYATRFMDTVGDGSGSTDLNVDGSTTPVIFKIVPTHGEILYLSRLLWYLRDTGSLDSGGFGNGPELTNGIDFGFYYDVGLPSEGRYPSQLEPITTNGGWAKYCGPDVVPLTFGSGDEILSCRYSFYKDVGLEKQEMPWLAHDRLEEFWLIVQDDLTGINECHCRIGMFNA